MSTTGGWYQGHGGARLWRLQRPVDAPVGAVLLNHGYGEHSGRYLHVIDALAAGGFAVIAPDHRGHGRSARLFGDIESLDKLLGDQHALVDKLEAMAPGAPRFVLGHSLGALFSLLLLAQDPGWTGAVLNGTAMSLPKHIHPATVAVGHVLARLAPWMPMQRFYEPGRGSRDPEVARRHAEDPFQYKGRIRAGTGLQVLTAIERAEQALPHLRMPVLLTHGTEDLTVSPSISARIHAHLGSMDKELHYFDGLRHEVHQEPERDAVVGRWRTWLRRRALDAG